MRLLERRNLGILVGILCRSHAVDPTHVHNVVLRGVDGVVDGDVVVRDAHERSGAFLVEQDWSLGRRI